MEDTNAPSGEVMQLDGTAKLDNRFDQNGRRNARTPYSFEHGYTRGDVPLEIWPASPLVQQAPDTGKLLVDFGKWTEPAGAPNVTYKDRNLALPFPWMAHQVRETISSAELMHEINNRLAGHPICPLPIYTPTVFLMLNGVRTGRQVHDNNWQAPVVNSYNVLLAYHQAAHILERSTEERVQKSRANIQQNYMTHSKRLLVQFAAKMDTDAPLLEYSDHLRRCFSDGGHAALEADETHVEDLLRMAGYLVTFQNNYTHLLEVKLLTLVSPALATLAKPFYAQAALPGAAESQPHYNWTVKLADETLEMALDYLRLKAAQKKLEFLVPAAGLSRRQMVHGISLHWLRLLLLVLTRSADGFYNTHAAQQ